MDCVGRIDVVLDGYWQKKSKGDRQLSGNGKPLDLTYHPSQG